LNNNNHLSNSTTTSTTTITTSNLTDDGYMDTNYQNPVLLKFGYNIKGLTKQKLYIRQLNGYDEQFLLETKKIFSIISNKKPIKKSNFYRFNFSSWNRKISYYYCR